MWERSELKRRAKEVLRKSYWKAFVVSIILVFLGEGSGSLPNFSRNWGSSSRSDGIFDSASGIDWGILAPFLFFLLFVVIIASLIGIALRIFIFNPLTVGGMRYFKQSAEQDVRLGYLGYAFNKDRYWSVVVTMLWRGFLNFLWYLLLIIPGIVKSYSYSQVPYILADNPNIGYNRAIDLSKQMTRGHKFRIFVLDLSFTGWIILGLLALLVGVLFVHPYIFATKAELYLALRHEALINGHTTEHELRMNPAPIY